MKLIDFGCAKLVDDNVVYRDMAGTPYYIAPEVLETTFNRTGRVCAFACVIRSIYSIVSLALSFAFRFCVLTLFLRFYFLTFHSLTFEFDF